MSKFTKKTAAMSGGKTGNSATMTPVKSAKPVVYLSDEKAFWNNDGQIFHSLDDLASGLRTMSNETYLYHADGYKNDYANWIKLAVGDNDAASELGKAADRNDAAARLARFAGRS